MSRRWFGLVVIAATFLFAALVFPQLPERIPTHWGASGEPDAWSDRWPSAFFLPSIALALWLLLNVLPRIGPRRAHVEHFEETWWLVANCTVLFLGVMTVVTLGAALGWPIDTTQVVLVTISVLFAVVGNYLPRVRSNWWMGIRTPWTLENETVWRETHRLGGRLMVAGGILAAAAALVLPGVARLVVVLGALLLAGFVPLVYSYVLWRRLGGS